MGKKEKPIRRCLSCGHKTHGRFWENRRCPVCQRGKGYVESGHGGLSEQEIEAERKVLLKLSQKLAA